MSLHYEAVSEELHDLLKQLMQLPELDSFYLVGGTSLALRYGHRISIDVDLFTHESFDVSALRSALTARFDLTESSLAANTFAGLCNGIKTDFIAHRYPLVGAVEVIDELRLLSVEDTAAMKLNAVANRGSKKDFYDIYELLQHFSCDTLLRFYSQKYPQGSVWNVQKSLIYFDDAETEPEPVDLKSRNWEQVKEGLCKACRLAE